MLDIRCLCRFNEVPTLFLLCLLGFGGIEPYSRKERPNCEVRAILDVRDLGNGNTERTVGQSQDTVRPRDSSGQRFRLVHVGLNDLSTISCERCSHKSVAISPSRGNFSAYLELYRY